MPSESRDPLRIESTTLASGLKLFRQSPPPAARSFSASFIAPAGWAYDAGRDGVAMLASLAGPAAAGRRDRVALAQHLDRYGAVLSRQCDPESAELTLWGPADALDPLLDVLADLVLLPRFERDDVERVRRQIFERQLRELSQPESRAERSLLESIFSRAHPYGRTGIGTHASIAKLRPDDLRRFHARQYTAAGSMLVITATPPLDVLARAVDRRFVELSSGTEPRPPAAPPSGRTPPKTEHIRMPGRAQVEIRVGGASIARSDPSYPGAFLANEVLGGRALLSRLFQNVRERAGLAYHASSDLEALRWGGYWQAQAGTGPERVEQATRLVLAEVERIRTELVRAPELDRMRESSIGELPLALETTQGAHELALDVAYHDLGPDFLASWPTTLRALTPKDVRDAAESAFSEARSLTVLAGPVTPASRPRSRGAHRVNTHK